MITYTKMNNEIEMNMIPGTITIEKLNKLKKQNLVAFLFLVTGNILQMSKTSMLKELNSDVVKNYIKKYNRNIILKSLVD